MRPRLFRPPVVIPMSDLETTKSDFVITRRRFKNLRRRFEKSRRRFLFFLKKERLAMLHFPYFCV